ncbi:cwf21 domain-containing protein [Kalaharituber pfeilii]|nr:cwf21 domain-containing protein [Kalaharituber pfeilii]
MSSNVGLSTPRGSGTSGYVQRNLSHLKPRSNPYPPPKDLEHSRQRLRQPDKDILTHEKKRDIEVKCVELRDKLEEEGVDEEEIEEKVSELRKKLLAELEAGGGARGSGKKALKSHQIHELAVAKMAQNARMEKALGISPDYEEGSHWQKQAQRKLERELGNSSKDSGLLRE